MSELNGHIDTDGQSTCLLPCLHNILQRWILICHFEDSASLHFELMLCDQKYSAWHRPKGMQGGESERRSAQGNMEETAMAPRKQWGGEREERRGRVKYHSRRQESYQCTLNENSYREPLPMKQRMGTYQYDQKRVRPSRKPLRIPECLRACSGPAREKLLLSLEGTQFARFLRDETFLCVSNSTTPQWRSRRRLS